ERLPEHATELPPLPRQRGAGDDGSGRHHPSNGRQEPAFAAIDAMRFASRMKFWSRPEVTNPNDTPVAGSPHAIWPPAPLWPNARGDTVGPMPRKEARPSSP